MSLFSEARLSDSPYVEIIEQVIAEQDGSTICPANGRWYLLVAKHQGKVGISIAGPLTKATPTTYKQGMEFLFIKFKMGTFLRHYPAKDLLNIETTLPSATYKSFWLGSTTWQSPDFDNVETFIEHLVRQDLLVHDTVVNSVLGDHPAYFATRTVRHRFLQSTGLNQNYIRQIERARNAKNLLLQGVSILDTVNQMGYSDQPHLTRSLKQFIGYTPAQITQSVEAELIFE